MIDSHIPISADDFRPASVIAGGTAFFIQSLE